MITIKEYVEKLFRNIPDNENSRNMKQEIIQNLQEKVMDLIESGKSEEDAVNKAIVEFGDIDEIRGEFEYDIKPEAVSEKRKAESKYKKVTNAFLFSLFGFLIIMSLILFINFYYTPRVIWFVYPLFGVIWWPLSMFFVWLNRRSKR